MTSTPRFDVICVGAVNVDTIVPVERVPADDERITSPGFITAGGGPAATAAVAIARLGGRVAFCGVVGDDIEGRLARRMFEDEGVDTRWIRVDPQATTARAVVLTSRTTAGRSIVTTVAPAPRPSDVPMGESTWLHADQIGYAATRAALRGRTPSASSGTMFSIDAGNPIDGLALGDVDLFAPTLAMLLARYDDVGATDADVDAAEAAIPEADIAGSRIAAALIAARGEGARDVVATAGADGTYVLTDQGVRRIPALAVHPISTLGAGDVFHGALLARLSAGDDLLRAVSAANVVAALSCRAVDGRSGIPTIAELDSHLSPDVLQPETRSGK